MGVALRAEGATGMTEPSSDIDEAMALIRLAVGRQLGVERPLPADIDIDTLPRFGNGLPRELSPERRAELEAEAQRLDPGCKDPSGSGMTS